MAKRGQTLPADARGTMSMPNHSQPETTTPNASDSPIAPGEIGMGIVWAVFYAIVLTVPVASHVSTLSKVVAFLSR
jgi:hypothetical protein